MAASKKHQKLKTPKHTENVDAQKRPKVQENPQSYLKQNPVWSFSRCDKEHDRWSIKSSGNLYDDIITKLISFEGMTWQEIQSASGGRARGTNNHFIPMSDLIKEAQKRAGELGILEDQLFSLRLTGSYRVFGILQEGVFQIIWKCEDHEICTSSKKHT